MNPFRRNLLKGFFGLPILGLAAKAKSEPVERVTPFTDSLVACLNPWAPWKPRLTSISCESGVRMDGRPHQFHFRFVSYGPPGTHALEARKKYGLIAFPEEINIEFSLPVPSDMIFEEVCRSMDMEDLNRRVGWDAFPTTWESRSG